MKPTYGLTEDEVEQMLVESIEHAEEDVSERFLREWRVEGDRIHSSLETAFQVVAEVPAVPAVMVPMAVKGDLEVPMGCEGPGEAECMDVAYEVQSEPSLVVETRSGTTSTLLRMDSITVAAGKDEALPHSE